ncbi:AraC family transcriptional regulator [Bacillus paranthracis]|uniref:helix-turn-helix domain-containing protein n=1 Tax=Bacillus paranthracis TaxID=2026186 RepID=UPI002E1FE116|nr:AraC family transcriptional regulator [Bacillus paranthracis]MED1680043.1 AraC family transcriptional regulator [Bacillus paranthracis]
MKKLKTILNTFFTEMKRSNDAVHHESWLGTTYHFVNGKVRRLYIEEGVEMQIFDNCTFQRPKIPILKKILEITVILDGQITQKGNTLLATQYDSKTLLFFNEIEEPLQYDQLTGMSVFLDLNWLERYLIQENQLHSWKEIEQFFLYSRKIIFQKESETIHRSIARYLQNEFKENAMNHLLIKAKVLEFLAQSLQKIWPEVVDQRIEGILDVIHQQFHLPIQVQQLAEMANMSESSMQSYFKASFGMSVYQYIQRKRVEYAAELLIHTNESITEISMQVGYDNPSKFAKIFKRIYGETPLHYRKKYTEYNRFK